MADTSSPGRNSATFVIFSVHALQWPLFKIPRRVPQHGSPLCWTMERSPGTIPCEDIECQLQGLDRSELGRRNRQPTCARAKAADDLKGKEEDGISELAVGTSASGEWIRLFLVWSGGDVGKLLKEIRTTESQF